METRVCLRCKKEKQIIDFYEIKSRLTKKGIPQRSNYCAPCFLEKAREDYHKNRDRRREANRKWMLNNKDSIAARNKTYRLNNADKMKVLTKDWISRNRQQVRDYNTARYTIRHNLPATLTPNQKRDTWNYFNNACAYCKRAVEKLQEDHFVPITAGGGRTKNNIVPACQRCNSSKKNKLPIEWIVGKFNSDILYYEIYNYLSNQDG